MPRLPRLPRLPRPRLLGLLVLAVAAFICPGCIGLLARAVVDPAGAAAIAGQNVAWSAAESVAGGAMNAIVDDAAALSDLDRLISAYPEASNIGELVEMREEMHGPGQHWRRYGSLPHRHDDRQQGTLLRPRLQPRLSPESRLRSRDSIVAGPPRNSSFAIEPDPPSLQDHRWRWARR